MKEFNLYEYLKDPSRKVVTRDGRAVRIICTDRKGTFPIIGLIQNKVVCYECVNEYVETGKVYTNGAESEFDLFFAPTKHEGWVNVYRNDVIEEGRHVANKIYQSEEEARGISEEYDDYVATAKIEWEE